MLELANQAFGIHKIPERDRASRTTLLACGLNLAVACRTTLLACGLNLAVANLAPFIARANLGFFDSLNAERALLHYPARAHSHVWIQREVRDRIAMLILKPVEAPNLIRTVVLTVAGPNAAVVDLHVQAFAAVHRRQNRTDALARCVVALIAHHRLIFDLRIFIQPKRIAVEPDPVHLALASNFIFADHRHVVLSLTTQHASRAANARVQIDDHRPLVLTVLIVLPDALRLTLPFSGSPALLFEEFIESELFDQRSAVERLMKLCRCELNSRRSLLNRESGLLILECSVVKRDQRISVNADTGARLARA